jgi:lantibiotic modifying enzyme
MEPSDALQLAVEATAFIDQLSEEDLWKRTADPDSSTELNLYHGAAGVVVTFLELSAATGIAAYRDRALKAGRVLAKQVLAKERSSVAFATGWPGYAFGLRILSEHAISESDRLLFKSAALYAGSKLVTQATRFEKGLGWIEPMPFSDITGFTGEREIYDLSVGAAGAGVALLDAHRSGLDESALESATLVAERLLEVGESTVDGLRWGLMSDMPFPFTAPNLAHGGAGVGYFLAQLYEACNDDRYLEAACSAARYTMSRATSVGSGEFGSGEFGSGEFGSGEFGSGEGCLVCHTEEQQPPSFYLGACHGPAGTGRLLALLYRLTGDTHWAKESDRLLNGLRALGAPAQRSWGWWNNYGQCCGDAGLGDYALSMFTLFRDTKYLELAHDCASVISSVAVRNAATDSNLTLAHWPQAEHRARPKFVQSQTGYMQGAAGIASFLVHLATAESDHPIRIEFPDERV